MGVDLTALDFLMKFRGKIRGATLQLGRQGFHIRTTHGSRERQIADSLIRKYDPTASLDDLAGSTGYTERLFHYLGSQSLTSMDASAYEGAEIIHDLNYPVPMKLESHFDTIFDAGTIEHVFDAPMAFENVKRMLKAGGLFLCVTPANNYLGHGFYQFSPELLWRLFSKEAGFQIELMQTVLISDEPKPVDAPDPAAAGKRMEIGATSGPTYILMAARKVADSKSDFLPQQSDYTRAWKTASNVNPTDMRGHPVAQERDTAATVVDLLYQGILRRPADQQGRATFIAALRNGLSIPEILKLFIDCPEFHAAQLVTRSSVSNLDSGNHGVDRHNEAKRQSKDPTLTELANKFHSGNGATLGSPTSVIVLQTADAIRYFDILQDTSRTVRRYCRRHGIAYEAFIGIKRGYWPWQATFNRIILLRELLERNYTGWVLYLDADAYVVDFDFNLLDWLRDKGAKSAIFVPSGATQARWDVNAGIFLINLGHYLGVKLARIWLRMFEAVPEDFLKAEKGSAECPPNDFPINDQRMLHDILKDNDDIMSSVYLAPRTLLNSQGATFIRQHLASHSPNLAERRKVIHDEVARIMANSIDEIGE